MSAIFISYRRQGALIHARAVFERLSREFGPGQVFIDLEGIDVGVDFVELIEQQLRGCHVLLALIDPQWTTAADSQGRRRLERPNDFVRIEIATALRRGIRVAPILIDGAPMPEDDALPEDLKPLARRNALMLDFSRFDAEMGRLVAAIRRILESPAQGSSPVASGGVPPRAAPVPAPRAPTPGPAPEPPVPGQPLVGASAARHGAAPRELAGPARSRRTWFAWAAAAGVVVVAAGLILEQRKPGSVPQPRPQEPASAPQPAAAATPTPVVRAEAPGLGKVFRDCPECPEMVVIPAGSFLMGSPDSEPGHRQDEGPQRQVSIGSFAMGKTEVTQAQWQALMGSNPSEFPQCGGDCPVERVSWDDVQEYLRRLSRKTGKKYVLPSEAQWEYAARSGTTTPFHTGPTITDRQANFDGTQPFNGSAKGEYRRTTVKVGSFAANGYGLHDMHGNVSEWVQDCYDPKAYAVRAPNDGRVVEVDRCASRVQRGGAWFFDAKFLRAAYRGNFRHDDRDLSFGFRVCRWPIE